MYASNRSLILPACPPGRNSPVATRGRPWSARLVLWAAAVALSACSKPAPAPEPARAVRTMTVGTAAAGASQEFAAELRARTETRLSFRVPGRLVQRPAEVGQRVRSGQVLAQLDAADLKLGQEAARSAVQAAQANVDLGAAELKRYQELRQQGFISALELERRETTLQAQRAQLNQAQAQLSVQGNQAGYATLVATAAGVVTAVEAEVGAVLAAGTPLLRLAHDGPRDVVFSVPEDTVAGLRQLMAVPGALQVKAWARPDALAATVREVAAAADPVTRTFLVKAALATSTPAAELQLGQTLTVRVQQPTRSGVVRLPLSAVVQQQGRTSVWLLDTATLTVRPQPVVVAGADGNQLIVAQGLAPGQVVVTAGVHTLTAGQKVQLYEAAFRADATASAPPVSPVKLPVAPPAAAAVAPAAASR